MELSLRTKITFPSGVEAIFIGEGSETYVWPQLGIFRVGTGFRTERYHGGAFLTELAPNMGRLIVKAPPDLIRYERRLASNRSLGKGPTDKYLVALLVKTEKLSVRRQRSRRTRSFFLRFLFD
jgi:hypothetical protein